jgi:hypothetical protein
LLRVVVEVEELTEQAVAVEQVGFLRLLLNYSLAELVMLAP